jgi:hypothetical protein
MKKASTAAARPPETDDSFRRAGYPFDAQGRPLDPETMEPLTEKEIGTILASEDEGTREAFQAMVDLVPPPTSKQYPGGA